MNAKGFVQPSIHVYGNESGVWLKLQRYRIDKNTRPHKKIFLVVIDYNFLMTVYFDMPLIHHDTRLADVLLYRAVEQT